MAKKNDELTTREISRLMQNERRKIEARMGRVLREEFGLKVTARQAAKTYATGKYASSELEMLSKEREKTFAKTIEGTKKRKGYDASLERISENVAAYTQLKYGMETLSKKGDVTQLRKNKLFERSINQSTKKEGFSTLDKDISKSFYAATQDIWKGKSDISNYNTAIMQKFGVNDLETVYKLLTDKKLRREDFGDTEADIEEYNKIVKSYGFTNAEDFENWLNDLNSKVKLDARRKVVTEELDKIGKYKSGGTTNDEGYNKSGEPETETSPEYINKIVSRIAVALNG